MIAAIVIILFGSVLLVVWLCLTAPLVDSKGNLERNGAKSAPEPKLDQNCPHEYLGSGTKECVRCGGKS